MSEHTSDFAAQDAYAFDLYKVSSTESLSPETVNELITAAQDVTVTVTDDRTVYGTTPESDAALARLTTAFLPMLHAAARRGASNLGREDAFATAYEAFIGAVRRHDVDGEVHFLRTASVIVTRAVADAARVSDMITVKEDVSRRYWKLMHKHGGDVEAAYAECREEANGFTPYTFLAAHHAISTTESLDFGNADALHPATMPGPEEAAVEADLVNWLFGLVDDKSESLLRLRFGFQDAYTETLRATFGYRVGELLDDAQAGHCLGLPRSTAQRRRTKAIQTMRDGMQQLADEELS
jgi:hypothetical protein